MDGIIYTVTGHGDRVEGGPAAALKGGTTMKTMLRILLVSALVALPYGIAKADPAVRGLIEVQDRPYYDDPTVEIWTDDGSYFIGETVNITVTVDRPSFVTVYNIDALGYVRRLTRDPRGVWVTPGRPLYLPENPRARLVATGPGGEELLIAVASPAPFAHYDELPFFETTGYDRLTRCDHDRDGFIVRTNERLLGRRPRHDRSVARATFWVQPERYYRYPLRIHTGIVIDIGFEIPIGGHVWVDGAYCGVGPRALYRLGPGTHKVTVKGRDGRKFSKSVTIPTQDRYRTEVERDRKFEKSPRQPVRGGKKR